MAKCGTCILHLSSLAVIINFFSSKFYHHGPLRAAPSPRQPPAEHMNLFGQSLTYGLHTAPHSSRAGCMSTKLPLSAPSPLRPFLSDVPASPRAERAETQFTPFPELLDPGLSHAQWTAAFEYNLKLSLLIFLAHFWQLTF